MSFQFNPDVAGQGRLPQDGPGEFEVVDAVPVFADGRPLAEDGQAAGALQRRHGAAAPAVQAAAAAAGGFVAGAALFSLVQRRQRRAAALARGARGARGQRGRRLARAPGESGGGVGELVQIVASRSLLVDVHLLAGPGGGR